MGWRKDGCDVSQREEPRFRRILLKARWGRGRLRFGGSGGKGYDGALVQRSGQAFLRARSGNDGVRDPRWGFGRYRDFGDLGVSPSSARALGCDCEQHQFLVMSECGQAMVEYVVVLAGVLCVIAGLGAFFNAFESGLVVRHAVSSASHHLGSGAGWVLDMFAY